MEKCSKVVLFKDDTSEHLLWAFYFRGGNRFLYRPLSKFGFKDELERQIDEDLKEYENGTPFFDEKYKEENAECAVKNYSYYVENRARYGTFRRTRNGWKLTEG